MFVITNHKITDIHTHKHIYSPHPPTHTREGARARREHKDRMYRGLDLWLAWKEEEDMNSRGKE